MSDDPLDDLLNLEEKYYQEGYDLGHADGAHAGLVEGKLFGVEKGFEKAMSIGRLAGRADVWLRRNRPSSNSSVQAAYVSSSGISQRQAQPWPSTDLGNAMSIQDLPPLSANARLKKHIESLLVMTDSTSLSSTNSDEAVAEFDERLTKAMAKAKVITNIIAEPLHVEDDVSKGHRSIEESGNLSARH